MKRFIQKTITKEQAKDTGMAMVLICLLIAFFGEIKNIYGLAILLLLINMTWPGIYKPLAKLWLSFSRLSGSVMSRIILTAIFIILVLPVGLIRRMTGKDSLRLKKWKKNCATVFKIREHEFICDDINHPY